MNTDISDEDKKLIAQFWSAGIEAGVGIGATKAQVSGEIGLEFHERDVDALRLAAWLDHRLSAEEAEQVEHALLADPALLDDAVGAFACLKQVRSKIAVAETVNRALVLKLQALIPADLPESSSQSPSNLASSATMLAFAPRQRAFPNLGGWKSWGALAASLLVISVTGVGVGVKAASVLSHVGASNTTEGAADSGADVWDTLATGSDFG